MKPEDLYHIIKDNAILASWRLIRRVYCKKMELTQADLELLMELHKHKTFIRKDFDNGTLTAGWDKHRWLRLFSASGDKWIGVERQRELGKSKSYTTYKVTYRAKRYIDDMYQMLAGFKRIPESPRTNPKMKRKRNADRLDAIKIIQHNSDFD